MADRRRRRRRASQDSEGEEEEEESGSDSVGSGGESGAPVRQERSEQGNRKAEPPREGKESECESEDGIEGDAVLSDYESADESEIVPTKEVEEAHYNEEEPLKATLKQENNVEEAPAARDQKPKSKGTVTGERQSGDGQESNEPEEDKTIQKSQKQLDDDEDRKNPAYIPRKGLFFEHDLRGHVNDEEVRPKGRHPRKLWKDEGRWVHDRFHEDEQAPKSREELISIYGYDIRSSKNPEEIRPRRPRKPRFSSPSRREENNEKASWPLNRYQDSGDAQPLRPYTNRSAPPSNKVVPSRTYSRQGGYKENRASYQSEEEASLHTYERRQDYGGHRARSSEQGPPPPREFSPEADPIVKEEAVIEKQAAEPSPPPPDRPVEKKSYSRARRSRIKVGDTGKSMEDTTAAELPPPPPMPPAVAAEFTPAPLNVKQGNWEPPAEGGMSGIDEELSQMNLTEQSWNQGQPAYICPRGIPNPMHMGNGPPQYSRMEGMAVQGGRVKRYSSQRQRPVPDPAAMHISLMESHYYDPLQFQGPIYTHGDSSSSMPPQGMIVPPEMHLSHPGMHPHPSPATMSTPNLYPAPVSLPPGQQPPQQLLPPPYFPAPPNVMNFGNPTYPYPPGALPPPPAHLYPNAQAQSQVYGGVTYYNPVQQQVQPKPSPPRRTSQPVTIKPPPPEENRHLKMNEKINS